MISTGSTDILNGGGFGGGYGGFGGGFGGIAPIGLFGVANGLFGRDRDGYGHKNDCNDGNVTSLNADGIAAKTAFLVNQNADQNALLGAIAGAKDQTVFEGRAVAAAFANTNDNIKDGNYAAAIQAERNTAQLASQAQLFQIQTEKSIDSLAAAGVAQTAAILARINDAEVQRLRDELHETRRGRDLDVFKIENNNTNTNIQAQLQAQAQLQTQAQLDDYKRRYDHRENEISIINTNTNINAQAQAQAQAQAIRDLDRDHRWNQRFETLINQNAKVAQDIINIGGVVAANQTSNPTNVNSKQSN